MTPADASSSSRYYCHAKGVTLGPLDLIELAAELRYGNIDAESLVCPVGAEEWHAFRDLPEYAAAQELSIETIARHLEKKEKEKGKPPASSPQRLMPWFWATILIVFLLTVLGVAGDQFFAQQPSGKAPAIAAVPEPKLETWHVTREYGFEVECPAPLKNVVSINPGVVESYRAFVYGAGYGVDIETVPGVYSAGQYEAALARTGADFVAGVQGHITSESSVKIKDCYGRKTLFTQTLKGMQILGGVCVLGGHGKVATAWVCARANPENGRRIDRYLKSFTLP